MKKSLLIGLVSTLAITTLLLLASCAKVDIKAGIPDYRSKPKLDSSNVPKTYSYKDCQEKLEAAYEYIRELEKEITKKNKKIEDLEEDKEKLKRKIKELEGKIDTLEDRLEKYED